MGGTITLESTPNEGSEFTCSLRVSSEETSSSTLPDVDISSLNILVVDDNATNREILEKQLVQWGAEVATCPNGESALLCCKQKMQAKEPLFDVTIIDMQMPTMNGAELATKLHSVTGLEKIQLIMMTSIQTLGDAQYFADLGFKGYFPKPATTHDLVSALKVLSDNGQPLAQATPLITHHYINELQKNEPTSNGLEAPETLPDWQILLVEDKPVNQIVAKGVLKNLGLTCDSAENGFQAISKLKA